MTNQNYLLIQENVVTNVVYWDGDVNTWNPPSDATMLVAAVTPAITWVFSDEQKDFVLGEVLGAGAIGFTWDGTVVTTNEPKPEYVPQVIPTTTIE